MLKVKSEALAATLAGDEGVAPTFDIDAMRKDLWTMMEEGHAQGIPLPVASQTLTALDEATAAGLGGHDCAYMPAYRARKGNG